MEIILLLVIIGIFAGVVFVAQKLHAARHWSVDPEVQRPAEPTGEPEPEERTALTPASEAEARSFVDRYVSEKWREGFLSRDDVINWVADAVDDEYPGSIAIEGIEDALDRAAKQLEREQATWPAVTDCDRLTQVFAKLDRAGIVAAENFSCCNNCGHGEMVAEMEQERLSRPVHGYAFYHAQDTERAAQGDGLYVRYGADTEEEEANARVGHDIFQAFTESGFAPKWDGSSSEAIFVPITWRKRRSAA